MDNGRQRKPCLHSSREIIITLAVVVFVIQFGNAVSNVPSTHLLEDIICRQYYHNSSSAMIPENLCSLEPIQSELNIVTTGQLVSSYIPGS